MKKNNKWVSLPLAMGLVLIMNLLAFAILEYIVPFSREIKWVENSSSAYYQANSWIEEWLYGVHTRNNSEALDDRDEYLKEYSWDPIANKFITSSSWNTLPPLWEGNSEYDQNWNTISLWKPIQLSVWNWYIDWGFEIAFRVPNLDKFSYNLNIEELDWSSIPIVNWQLSWNSNALNAGWGIILISDILDSNENFEDVDIWWKDGVDLLWNTITIENFYDTNCDSSKCTLKFSIVNKLETSDSPPITIPYLEWQLRTSDINDSIPLRYTKIESSWKSYWYKKDLEIKVAWQSVNEAFDFTVFQ